MRKSWQPLQDELENPETSDQRRLEIGKQLAAIGDQRPGVGVKDGLPDIKWLPIEKAGEVIVTRAWLPESPNEEARILSKQAFDVEPFYIAKYQITVGQYQTFVDAADGFNNSAWWKGMPERFQQQPLASPHINLPNHPRDSLSWYQCIAFARWMNHQMLGRELPHPSGQGQLRVGENAQIRLPTEWEWQWAAQNGDEARPYPWGEAKPGYENVNYANTSESGLNQAIAVGMYPHGAADCGAMDMSGNLMEWCANNKSNPEIINVSSEETKVLRGGDWGYALDHAMCTYCDDDEPSRADILNGCRLVLV